MATAQIVVASADTVGALYTAPTPAGTVWTARAVSSGQWARPATDGNGTYVASAGVGLAVVSTDNGVTWSAISATLGPFVFFYDTKFHSFRQVNANSMVHQTSTNGSTWTENTVSTSAVSGWVPTTPPAFINGWWVGQGTQNIASYIVGVDRAYRTASLDQPWTLTNYTPDFGGKAGTQGPFGGRLIGNPMVSNARICLSFSKDVAQPSWTVDSGNVWTAGTNTGTGRILHAVWTGTKWFGVGSFIDTDFVERFSWADSTDGKAWTHHNDATLGTWQGWDTMWDGTYVWAAAMATNGAVTNGAVFRCDPAGPTWTRILNPASTTGLIGVTGAAQPMLFDRAIGTVSLLIDGAGSNLRDTGFRAGGTAPLVIDGTGSTLRQNGPFPLGGATASLLIDGAGSTLRQSSRPVITAPNMTLTALTTGTALPPGGIRTDAPPVTLAATTDGWLTWPPSTGEWWAVLVNKTGGRRAALPTGTAIIDPVVESLNQIGSAAILVTFDSPAGQIVAGTPVAPQLEVQIWRGDRLWFFGPVTDVQPHSEDTYQLTLKDPAWFLSRTHVGKMGGALGGYHGGARDGLKNPSFADGLTGWQMMRTVSYGDFPGFGTMTPGQVALSTTVQFPGYPQCVKFDAPKTLTDSIQIFQDLEIIAAPQRPLKVRFSGYWWIPSGADYKPTNRRFALLLTKMPLDANLPVGYYTESFYEPGSHTNLGDLVERDKPVYHECTITFPPGAHELLHVAICPPQGVSYFAGAELRGDDGLDYINWDPSAIAQNLVVHAQDPVFGKLSANLVSNGQPTSYKVDRTYVYEDHQNIWAAQDQLARDGYFDHGMMVGPTTRTYFVWSPKRGSFKPQCRVVMDANGVGNIATLKVGDNWSSASTAVAGTSQTKGGRHEQGAFTAGATVTLEQVFAADRDTKPAELAGRVNEHLEIAEDPTLIEFTCRPGDERFLLGLGIGDQIPVNSDMPSAVAHGTYRVIHKTTDPTNDVATFKLSIDT